MCKHHPPGENRNCVSKKTTKMQLSKCCIFYGFLILKSLAFFQSELGEYVCFWDLCVQDLGAGLLTLNSGGGTVILQ